MATSRNGIACCMIALAAGLLATGARAADLERGLVAEPRGTLALAPSEPWAELLDDAEMADMRGGFNGLAFSVSLSGLVTSSGNAFELSGAGTIGDTSFEFSPDFGDAGGQVTIQSFVGDSLNGFRGIFQAANVIGEGIVVDQTLIMNVNVFLNSSTAPTSLSLFGG